MERKENLVVSKLDKLRDKEGQKHVKYILVDDNRHFALDGYQQGFNKVMELNLAVKFYLFTLSTKDFRRVDNEDRWWVDPKYVYLNLHITTQEFYDYWINKIYKP